MIVKFSHVQHFANFQSYKDSIFSYFLILSLCWYIWWEKRIEYILSIID